MAVDDRRRGDSRVLQVSTWRGDAGVAVVNPTPDHADPSPHEVGAELERLRSQGVRGVLTGALHQHELGPFLANGFTPHERLHLLRHHLREIPAAPPVRLRRAWRRDRPAVLDVDTRAFDTFWALDRRGLDDAVRATPISRFQVVGPRNGPITGYAVTGRSGERGYLQRLAVHPDVQRAGVGTALVADALWWLRRGGARLALVNTQERNTGALALYEACGFELEPSGLTVLTLDLGPGPGTDSSAAS